MVNNYSASYSKTCSTNFAMKYDDDELKRIGLTEANLNNLRQAAVDAFVTFDNGQYTGFNYKIEKAVLPYIIDMLEDYKCELVPCDCGLQVTIKVKFAQ